MISGKVSIVILNWNQWDVTVRCLDSLRLLDYHNFDVIVVDNASDTQPPAEIPSILPGIILIRNDANYGFGKGNNPGITRAIENGADKIRLNPGNIYKEDEIREVVMAAKKVNSNYHQINFEQNLEALCLLNFHKVQL